MTFQTNFYYDLPQVLQWEIQRFIAPEKPTRHPDAASLIKAKNVVVREHWVLIKELSEVVRQCRCGNTPLCRRMGQDVHETLQEIIVPEVARPHSIHTMCDMNYKINYWLRSFAEDYPKKGYLPLMTVMENMHGMPSSNQIIRFKPGIQIKACDKFYGCRYK